MMIKIAVKDFVYERDVPSDCIGVLSTPDEVTIFLPGDESTPGRAQVEPSRALASCLSFTQWLVAGSSLPLGGLLRACLQRRSASRSAWPARR